jgi:putative salt-induced outer membrane protein YdiY
MKPVKLSLLLLAMGCSSHALAHDPQNDKKDQEKKKPPLTGTAELGFLYKSGDVKSYDFKSRLDIRHEFDRWRNSYVFDVLVKQTEEEMEDGSTEMLTTDQRWYAQLQSNYSINPQKRNYLFGYLSYEDDRFGSYQYQSSLAGGWGKRWYENKNSGTFFDAEIGPGFSHAKTEEEQTTENMLIIRTSATYAKKFMEKIEFKQTIGADIATEKNENTKVKAISSLSTKLIGSLGARFSFTVDYNSEVEEGKENTNTETNLTFVYSF